MWNWMFVELLVEDGLVRPMIGPGALSRAEAHREIQQVLDRGGPALAAAAEQWRRGAGDDTVYAGPLLWCLYDHPDGEDPTPSALAWLEDYARIIRDAGVDVQVAQPPS